MAEYSNTVLPQTASKSHNLYILSLFDLKQGIFDLMKLSLGSSVNNKRGGLINAYAWDLYKLADLVATSSKYEYLTINSDGPWRPFFAKSYNDNSGNEIYRRLNSFNPLTLENSPSFSSQNFSGSFSFSPLININASPIEEVLSNNQSGLNQYINDQAAAEFIVYLASRIPLFPVMICSSIASHYTFGPIFLNRISFSVNGGDSLSAVDVDCNFIGGKILISPDIRLLLKKKPGIEPIIYNEMNDLQGNPIPERASNFMGGNYDYHRYRSVSLLDVIIDRSYQTSLSSLKATLDVFKLKPPAYKITRFEMTVNQNISLEYTNPYHNGVYKRDVVGPKYAGLTSREVSGSITYFAFNKTLDFDNTSALTVYLGGPFFYAMKYVDWGNPVVTINPGGGYTHTYNFKARLPEQVGFPSSDLTKLVSEFGETSAFSIIDYIKNLVNNFLKGNGVMY